MGPPDAPRRRRVGAGVRLERGGGARPQPSPAAELSRTGAVMTDFLSRLLQRERDPADPARIDPRLPSLFESDAWSSPSSWPEQAEVFPESSSPPPSPGRPAPAVARPEVATREGRAGSNPANPDGALGTQRQAPTVTGDEPSGSARAHEHPDR